MANCPKGFWGCPNCGSFNEEYRDVCCDCGHKNPNSLASTSQETKSSSNKFFSFFEKFLQNPGKKIQWFAIVDFIVSIAAGIVCAAVLSRDRWGDFDFWKAIQYFIMGITGGYVTAVIVYALGSFIADTAENKAALARVEAQLKQVNHRFEKASDPAEEQKTPENDEK